MFKHLYEVARHTPLHLIITPNGAQLSIIVTPKPSGTGDSSALAKPFRVTGTPEELDAEFPGAIEQYTKAVNDVRASLDLPLDALEAEKKKAAKKDEAKAEKERKAKEEEERRSAAAKKAAETRAENAKQKAAEEEARKRARADKRAAKKGAPPALPGATEPLPTAAAPAAEDGKHRPNLPGKAECIRDYQQLKLKHGDKLTRRLFIKKAETSRRYEKLWPNWEKFVREAGAQQQLPLEESTRGEAAEPSSSGSASGSTPDPRSEQPAESAPSERAEHPVIPIVPVSEEAPDEHGAASADDETPRRGEGAGTHTDVYDESGAYLSSITTKPQVGEHIGLVSQEYLLRVTKMETRPSGGLDLTVVPDPEESRRQAEAIADKVREQVKHAEELERARQEAARPRFQVHDEATGEMVAEYKWPPSIGEKLVITGQSHPYRVLALEAHNVTARRVLPTRNRIALEGTGELLGHTEEIYEIADQVAELTGKEYRVVKVELDAYVVRATKPRVKGPLASAEPVTQE